MIRDAWKFVRSLFDALLDQPVDELVLRLTLLVLILHGASESSLDIALKILCGFLLLSPAHLKNAFLWGVLCATIWAVNATHWLWIDNHKFLLSYWTLACAVAVSSGNPGRVLAWNGRILIGLAFVFAVIWKLSAGQYLNGEFFYHTLLTDGRFEPLAHHLGGISLADLEQAKLLEEDLRFAPSEAAQASLPDSPRLLGLSLILSYWALLIETAIALTFLLPKPAAAGRVRDWILLGFIVTTYPVAPVLGFGYTLVILGLAACPPERTAARTAYLIVLAVLQLTRLA